jgi:hypothetical protein
MDHSGGRRTLELMPRYKVIGTLLQPSGRIVFAGQSIKTSK